MVLPRYLASVILSGVLVGSLPAQDHLLKQQEKLQAVAVQKVDSNVRDAISEAQKLRASGSTLRASERIKSALRAIEDPILPKKNVDAWRAQLNESLRNTETAAKPAPINKEAQEARDAQKAKLQKLVEDDKAIQRKLETIAVLYRANELKQAKIEISELASKYPDNPTVAVLPNLINRTQSIAEIQELHARQMENDRLLYNEYVKAMTVPKGDIEYDAKRWKEITEARKPKLSPKMQAVMTSLKSPVEIDVKSAPLSELLKLLSDKLQQPITIDKATMQEVGIESSTLGSLQTGTEVQGRTALKMLLANYNLTYIVRDGRIQVVTRERAAQTMETRVYYMGDVVLGTGGMPGAFPRPGQTIDPALTQKNVDMLIDHIKKSTDAGSWKGPGTDGKGDITFHWPSMSIIVRASAEVHGLLGSSLGAR